MRPAFADRDVGARGQASRRRGSWPPGGTAAEALGSVPRKRIVFGAILAVYPKLHAAVPGAIGLRMYFGGENVFPAAWPDPHPGAWITLSLRPNPGDLFSG